MEQQGLNLKLTGSGRAVEQYPHAGELIPYGKGSLVHFGALMFSLWRMWLMQLRELIGCHQPG